MNKSYISSIPSAFEYNFFHCIAAAYFIMLSLNFHIRKNSYHLVATHAYPGYHQCCDFFCAHIITSKIVITRWHFYHLAIVMIYICFCSRYKSHAAIALALILSITPLIPSQTDRSVNTSTTLPLSVKGASCRTDKSFIRPLRTMYSTIWFTK